MRLASPFALALVAVACSSSSTNGSSLPAGQKTITLTMQQSIPGGQEQHRCRFFQLPVDAAFVVSASHTYTPGSHHVLLFRTDYTSMPAGYDGAFDCYAGGTDGNGVMGHVRGVVYGAQTPTGQSSMPSGVGLELARGEVVLFQSHYLNASRDALDARIDVTLTVSDGTGIGQRAGTLFYYDPFIVVPAHTTGARAQMRCKVPKEVTLVGAASHYHARGVGYEAYLDPPSGPPADAPFYTSNDWDHPKSLAAPIAVAAGSSIRFSCTYDNADAKDYFQGPSATDDEMCMFIGTYYPRLDDPNDEWCLPPRSDDFGTGTTGCGATLSCISACPPLPKDLGIGNADVDPCWQKCFVASCPATAQKLFALNDCTTTSCPAECADSTSSACASCATSKCGDTLNACLSDACN